MPEWLAVEQQTEGDQTLGTASQQSNHQSEEQGTASQWLGPEQIKPKKHNKMK